ncbi:MAG: AraC family transcriptional regulator, partial [Bryobacteraceae bacterium]
LARVVRFQQVLRAAAAGPVRDWAALALSTGYYDQAHCIRDFREFSGESPAAYAARVHGLSDFFLLPE